MNKDPKISDIQVRGIIVSTVIGVGVLTLPNTLGAILGKDGWMAIIIGGLLSFPLLTIINGIFKKNPGKDYFEIGKSTLGNIIFTICLIIFLAYLIIFLAFVTRNLGELIKAFLLPTTPVELIIFLFILSTSYIASYEIDVIARAGYFIYPVIIGFAVLVIIVSLPTADFTNVLPVFQSDLKSIVNGVKETFFTFTGFEMILFVIPYVEEKEKTLKSSILAMGIVTLINFALFIMTLTQFSIEEIKRHTYPVLMLAKLIDLPGYFLQNLDGVFMAIWVLAVFGSMAPAYFGAGKILCKIFKTKSHKYFIWMLIPLIFWTSLIPRNFEELYMSLGKYFNILGFISVVIVPLSIFIVGKIKKKVGK